MLWFDWRTIASFALTAAALVAVAGFGLLFNPGWANDWPGGLSIHVVWPAVLTAVVFVLLASSAVGAGAGIAGFYESRTGRTPGKRAALIWLFATLLVTGAASVVVFVYLRADASAMWPTGYNP